MTPADIRDSTKNAPQGIIAVGEFCSCSSCVMVRALADEHEAVEIYLSRGSTTPLEDAYARVEALKP